MKVSDEPLVSVRDLEVTFSGRGPRRSRGEPVRAVRGVSFEIQRGESVGLVGESGSGKSTVARVIAGLQRPTAGSTDVRDRHDARRSRVGMIFQDPYSSLNPRQRIGAAVIESLRVAAGVTDRDEQRDRARDLLGRVGISPAMMDRFPQEFSGGQRQRIAIARALAGGPDLLLCDEPTSALDVSVQSQVLRLLRELQRDLGLSLLVITHDLGVVAYSCDRILVMNAGEVVDAGTVEYILSESDHPYTAELLSAHPRVDHIRNESADPW